MLQSNKVYFFDSEEFEEIIYHYMDIGKMNLANKAIDLSLSQHPGSIPLKLMKVELLVFENKIKPATKLLNLIENIDPTFDEIYIQRASILSKSKVLIIDYSELNIQSVFKKYFKEEYPFNGTDKKSEFPDAFALALIEKWCIEKGIKCKVFSSDKDFLNFKSEYLEITKDYEIYLDEKLQYFLTQEHRFSILQKLFDKNGLLIDREIEEWYRNKLDDDSLYYSVIWFEIHNIEITDITVNHKDYQIVAIEDEAIEIEVEVELTFKVELLIDDEDYSHYDNEDKVTYYFETKTEEIERKSTAKISLLAFITDENEFEDEFEVLEVNKDFELKIEPEYEDYR